MIGAILGDIIGAPYEFDRGNKTKDFPLFSRESCFTDDTVMTVAVGEAMLAARGWDDEATKAELIRTMQRWGRRYPHAGYGGRFIRWLLFTHNPEPNNSFGNGSAMRVSSVGWLYDDLETTRRMAALTASVSHNHPEGIKGAEATAGAIFLARKGATREQVVEYMAGEFGYELKTCAELRPGNRHNETCQVTMPLVIAAINESDSYEDAIRTAVSLGGDTDTIACIVGGIAEALYGVPAEIIGEGVKRLPSAMCSAILRWQTVVELGAQLGGKKE